jgi:hypothetical protein
MYPCFQTAYRQLHHSPMRVNRYHTATFLVLARAKSTSLEYKARVVGANAINSKIGFDEVSRVFVARYGNVTTFSWLTFGGQNNSETTRQAAAFRRPRRGAGR